MTIKGRQSTLLGARASTAGDVFHELWALRAILELLNSYTTLKAVTIEGILTPLDDLHAYDGVDCGLFYGGDTLEAATHVEFIQLKYSTAEPTKSWTIARLVENSAKKGNNSVVRKLAADFKNAKQRLKAGATLTTKLISNQPIASEVDETTAKIVSGNLSDEKVKKIIKASGLKNSELIEFARALDFSDMNSKSRVALLNSIVTNVSQMLSDNADPLVSQLRTRIRDLMLPGAEREFVTRATVLSWFGISSQTALFPAPTDLQPLINPIRRAPAIKVRDAILNGTTLVCLHGLGAESQQFLHSIANDLPTLSHQFTQ